MNNIFFVAVTLPLMRVGGGKTFRRELLVEQSVPDRNLSSIFLKCLEI